MIPYLGYGQVRTIVVISCTFPQSVGTDDNGGELILRALHRNKFGKLERIVVLMEKNSLI
jgi:hypothetical protein